MIETNVGNREGLTHAQFDNKDPWFPDKPIAFGGKTTEQITARLQAFYDETLAGSDADVFIIVTHASPALLFAHLIQPNVTHNRFSTAGISVFIIKDD